MAEVVAGDPASVLAINDSMGEESDIFSCNDLLVIEWMVVNIAACGVDLDAIHGCGIMRCAQQP